MDYARDDFNYQWGNAIGKAYVQAKCNFCGGIGGPTYPHKEDAAPWSRTRTAEDKTRASVEHTHACALDKAAKEIAG